VLDHLRLSARDVAAAERFYDPLLRRLGFAPEPRDDNGLAWRRPDANGRPQWLIVTPASAGLRDVAHRDFAPGLQHLAFAATSRGQVDELHAILVDLGAEVIAPPDEYDDDPDCYAVFFRDPDGVKLELVHRGAPAAPR